MAAPVFVGLDNSPTFTENGPAQPLDGNATLTDADSPPYDGATLTLVRSTGANANDLFNSSFFNEGQLTVTEPIEDPPGSGNFTFIDVAFGSYALDGGALVITFNDQATAARVNALLQSLTYANASESPPSSVQINYTFDNGEQAIGSITVNITAVSDAPSIDFVTPGSFFQPGSGGNVLSSAIQISDVDSAMLSGATVQISAFLLAGDTLSAATSGTPISAIYSAGTLTLSGAATVAQYRQVLATVAFGTVVADPTNGGSNPTRTLTWQITDSSSTVSGTTDSQLGFSPGIDLDTLQGGFDYSTTFAQGGAAVPIASTDVNLTQFATPIESISVILGNAKAGDMLSAGGGPLSVAVDTSQPGVIQLSITGTGTEADFENALESVVFSNAGGNIDPTTRSLSIFVADQQSSSIIAHSTIAISGATNDPGAAADDVATVAMNTPLAVAAAQGVLANDNDPDGLVVITGNVGTSQGGTIAFAADGSYNYTPASNFVGTDTVVYTAQDPFGSQVNATLGITVYGTGSPGDDDITAPPGDAQIDGGTGTDKITFDFRLVDATVTYSGNHVTIDGPSSHTVLSGFEEYVFTDGTVDNNDGSWLVDDLFYYSKYHDVWNAHADAETHYNGPGWHENRDPSFFFSTNTYLSSNPDVNAADVNPLTHFDQSGWQEGRVPSLNFDPRQYLDANPDIKAANIDPLLHFLQDGAEEGRQPFAPSELVALNGFDFVFYLVNNPDVAAPNVDPFQHFMTVGWKEGRDPNALFDVSGYLANYGDVAAANVNPLDHYHQFGWKEGRDPSPGFDTSAYLAAYPDVAAAGIDPLAHFLKFGQHEGRSAFADGVWG